MNVLGTVEGAGRSRRRLLTALFLGMVLGVAALVIVLGLLHYGARSYGLLSLPAVALVLAVLLILELTGGIRLLAMNRRVPPGWVRDGGARAGLVWGAALGSGLATEAPYGVLHASLALAVLNPASWPVVAVPITFGTGRLIVTAIPGIRRGIVERAQLTLEIAGRTIPAGALIARVCSRVALLGVFLGAMIGVIHG
jgi:hypothetical protein